MIEYVGNRTLTEKQQSSLVAYNFVGTSKLNKNGNGKPVYMYVTDDPKVVAFVHHYGKGVGWLGTTVLVIL